MIIRNDGTGTPCFIMITRCSSRHLWYKEIVGEAAHVIDNGIEYLYDVREDGRRRYICYEDAILLEEE